MMKYFPNNMKSPIVAVGAVVFKDNRVLLIRRGRPPALNIWAIPGGRVKLGETLQTAAEREILEETGVVIKAGDPIYTFDLLEWDTKGQLRFHYVIVDLVADYQNGCLCAGDDAKEAKWVSQQELELLDVSEETRKLLKDKFCFGRQSPDDTLTDITRNGSVAE